MTLEEKEDGEVDRRTAVAMFAGSGMVKKAACLQGEGFPLGRGRGTGSEWRPHLLGMGFVTGGQ